MAVQKLSGFETRAMSFSHIQRGGTPTAIERINASLMGLKAVESLCEGKSGIAIGIVDSKTITTPILEALAKKRDNRSAKAKKYNDLNQV